MNVLFELLVHSAVFLFKLFAIILFIWFIWGIHKVSTRQHNIWKRRALIALAGGLLVMPMLPTFPGRLLASAICTTGKFTNNVNDVVTPAFIYPDLPAAETPFVRENAALRLREIIELLAVKKFTVIEVPAWDYPGQSLTYTDGWPAHRILSGYRRYYISERMDPNCRDFNRDLEYALKYDTQLMAKIKASGLLPDLCIAYQPNDRPLAPIKMYLVQRNSGILFPPRLMTEREIGLKNADDDRPISWKRGYRFHEDSFKMSIVSPFTFIRRKPITCGAINWDRYSGADDIDLMIENLKPVPDADLMKLLGTYKSSKVKAFYAIQ